MIETELDANVELSGRNDDRIELIEKSFKLFELGNRNQTRLPTSSMVEPAQIDKINEKIKALRRVFESMLHRCRSSGVLISARGSILGPIRERHEIENLLK